MEADRLKLYYSKAIPILAIILAAATLCLIGAGAAAGKISLPPSPDAAGSPKLPNSDPWLSDTDSDPGSSDTDSDPMSSDADSDPRSPDTDSNPRSPDTDSDPMSSDTDSDPMSSNADSDPWLSDAASDPQFSDPASGLVSPETIPPLADGALDETNSQESGRCNGKNAELLRCINYNEKKFMRSVNDASPVSDRLSFEKDDDAGSGTIMGGILPHHLVAGRLIAGFFRTLAEDPPETLIVIGPNHLLEGVREIQTTPANWSTPFGVLEADSAIVARLAEETGAARNDDLFENEHSVSSLVPYIKYYLPETKIVPVVLHGTLSYEEAKKFGSVLAEIVSGNPGTVVIASIDFSHYLSAPEADEMDIITWKAITSWDFETIRKMDNDNLDSVPSITTILTAMDAMSAKNIDLTGHNNSSRITGSSYDYTTSYFTMFFRKDGQSG
jgi:AmmeMemoRadiSam system protein B